MKTIADIKRGLPDVRVIYKGRERSCRVLGRLLPFAEVYIPVVDISFSASWECIAQAVNNNTPIKF